MPWDCTACGVELADDVSTCPTCSARKTAWTLVEDRTRTLTISRKKFTLWRGDGNASYPADGPAPTVKLAPAEVVTVVDKAEVRRVAERGHLPASASLLFVGVHAQRKGPTATVEPLFESLPSEELTVEAIPEGDVAYAKLLFVRGEGSLDDVSFPEVAIVDVSEETEAGFAPSVEFSALGKPPRELPTTGKRLRVFAFSM